MIKTSLSTILHESLSEVVGILFSQGELSRAEISSLTGLSQMTVGKMLDILTEKKLVTLRKADTDRVGRKSSLVALDTQVRFAVFDYDAMKLCVIGIRGEPIAEYSLCEQSVIEATLACVEADCELRANCLIQPNRAESESLREFYKLVGDSLGISEFEICASARGMRKPDDRKVLYLRYGDEPIGILIRDSKPDSGALRRIGAFTELVSLVGDFETALRAAILISAPDVVRIEYDGSEARERLENMIASLGEKAVEFELTERDRLARYRGIALHMLDELMTE